MDIGIIGGGAAGMMCAAVASEKSPRNKVYLIEKNSILGSKVLITGGGRCNLTNLNPDFQKILDSYPRGKNFLKLTMHDFSPKDVFDWFEAHKVPLKVEENFRVFPKSDKSADIVKVFENIFKKNDVRVLLNSDVKKVEKKGKKFIIHFVDDETLKVDKLVLTTGGSAYKHTGSSGDGYAFAKSLGHTITKLAPSLGAFRLKESWVKNLAGVSFKNSRLKIHGEKLHEFTGAFLFTHKGVSGPAVFALSSLSAFEVFDERSHLFLNIDFFSDTNYEELTAKINREMNRNPKKSFINILSHFIPKSLAESFCNVADIDCKKPNNEVSKSDRNKIIESLKNSKFEILERSTGDEFVTAGGVSLNGVSSKTMESKICPGLYFAGELLDIDGFTGGFNLQSAWTTGRLVGKNL